MKKEIGKQVLDIFLTFILPVLIVLAFIKQRDICLIVIIFSLIVLLVASLASLLYIVIYTFINDSAVILAWRYVNSDKHGEYNIQAQKRFLGISWWSDEHFSISGEDAAKAAVERLWLRKNKLINIV